MTGKGIPAGPASGPKLQQAPTRIEGRAAGGWVVGGRLHPPALLATAADARSLAGLELETLDAASIPPLPDGVDLLLLGTGTVMKRAPRPFAEAMRARGVRVEPMDSQAAARTFNVLLAEDRLVAALLL